MDGFVGNIHSQQQAGLASFAGRPFDFEKGRHQKLFNQKNVFWVEIWTSTPNLELEKSVPILYILVISSMPGSMLAELP